MIELNPDFAMAYFNRAVVRNKQLDYNMSQAASSQDDFSAMSMNLKMGKNPTVVRTPATSDPASVSLKDNKRAYEHEMITRDYDIVIKLNPVSYTHLTLPTNSRV